MPETKTKLLTVDLDPETRRRLERIAEADAVRVNLPIRSLAWTVRRLIRAEWDQMQDGEPAPKKTRKKPGQPIDSV